MGRRGQRDAGSPREADWDALADWEWHADASTMTRHAEMYFATVNMQPVRMRLLEDADVDAAGR